MQKFILSRNGLLIGLLIIVLTGTLLVYLSTIEAPQATIEVVDAETTDVEIINESAFVDNQTCQECHAQQFDDWLGSHHEEAMQLASSQTVLGDFNDVTFTNAGVTSRFFQQEDQFFVNTQGPDGEHADFEVKYTFGVHPLQQYLLEFPNGRLQAFTVSWDTDKGQWFSLYPDEEITPENPIHWTGRFFTANSSCIECHTTNMTLNYDLEADSYETTWDEDNVSCQACHGPANDHIQWAQGEEAESEDSELANKGFLTDYRSLEPQEQIETCARCHSRRYSVSENDSHGHSFFDDFMPELLRDGLYHANGQILDEVYVYGSYVQSKMYHEGVGCMDCHNPHSLKLHQQDNQLCVDCHQQNPPKQRFETLLSKAYDSPTHHFHEVGSEGAQCVNCHMPSETYMVIDPRRDHSFSIPRPDLTLQWGTPNTCAECHNDKGETAKEIGEWAVAAMDQWYGPQWQDRPNVTSIMTMARIGDPVAEVPLFEVINDDAQPAIVRATALDLLTQYGPRGLALMIGALSDSSPLVRATALKGLEALPDSQKVQVVESLLDDPIRGVRVEAARLLASTPKNEFDQTQWDAFGAALEEYKTAQLAQADHPEGYMNLGNLYAVMGLTDQAKTSYTTAIERESGFLPAHNSLAIFYYQSGLFQEAEDTFRQALSYLPNEGSLYYSLGLLLVEQQRLEDAATELAQAARLLPDQQRLHYNYGLVLQKLGQMVEAEKILYHAYDIDPENQEVLVALTTFYRDQKRIEEAMRYAEQLNELYPNVPAFLELLDSIQ